MSHTVLFVDGYDTSLIDLVVDSPIQAWRDGLEYRQKFRLIPNKYHAIQTGTRPQTNVRILGIQGAMLADTVPTLLANLDALNYRLSLGELTIQFADDVTRHFLAYQAGPIRVTGIHPSLIQKGHHISFDLVCLDPRQYEDAQQSIGFTAATDMPMGTAPVEPVLTITVGTFTITSSGGETLTVSGATSPPITVDMYNQTIVNSASASMLSKLTGGNFFSLDPKDGDFLTTTWPTLATAGGSGTAVYNKAYL